MRVRKFQVGREFIYTVSRHVYIGVFIKRSGQPQTPFSTRHRLLYDTWSKFFNFLDGRNEEWGEGRRI
jgi:hypothetical protein